MGVKGKKVKIDEEQVLKLAQLGCKAPDIAKFFNCSDDTIRNKYRHIIEKGFENLKVSLRRAQIQLALSGNASLLIFLGKQYLGQRDIVIEDNELKQITLNYQRVTKIESENE